MEIKSVVEKIFHEKVFIEQKKDGSFMPSFLTYKRRFWQIRTYGYSFLE